MAKEIRNHLINHILDRELTRCARKYLRGRLVDIGCGSKPYAKLLSPFLTEHIGLDHHANLGDHTNGTLRGTAYQIPSDDETFDSVLCTAVLEHLEEPEDALNECCRVLKPGGYALYTVPFIWHLHEEPRDFYRFSKYGLQYVVE